MSQARILIVEDEAIVARDIARQLTALGYEPVGETGRGEEAIELAGRLRPDLVLMDIQLAGAMNGIEAAQVIRERFSLPVVFLTAFTGGPMVQRAKSAEPFGYLVKPFDPQQLGTAVEMACHQHGVELRLRASREELATILRTAMDGFWINDTQGRILEVNEAQCQMLGYTRDELLGLHVPDIEANETADDVAARFAQVRRDGAGRFETRLRRKHGGLIDVEACINFHPTPTGRVFCFFRDITERKRAQQALQASEAKFATVFRSAPLSIALTEPADGTYLEVNDEFLRATGYARHEVIGRKSTDLGTLPPGCRAQMLELLRRDGRITALPLTVSGKNGQRIECLLSADIVEIGGQSRLLSLALDTTAHKRLEAQLRQAQKMEAVGQLAGGVAHDFNNILAAIALHLGLLRDAPGIDAETRAALRELEKETSRGAGLTRQLLAFSRQQAMEVKPVRLNEVLENLLKMLRRVLGERITVEWKAQSALPSVEADVGMLEQVVVNLCVNARDAMPNGGSLQISTDTVLLDERQAKPDLNIRPGRYVRLSISDTGCGMDEATLARIFEPFFTTKEIGQGTGLGLAIVHGIVKQHGGWVEVESIIGNGTTFRVLFPATQLKTDDAPLPPADGLPHGHNELVIAIEDEESVRTVLSITLRRYGYRALLARNGPEALDLWQAHRAEIALVLTDMVLPGGMSGIDLIQRFREERPQLPVILASGYMKNRDGLNLPGVITLPKPFEIHTLLTTLRTCLDKHPPA